MRRLVVCGVEEYIWYMVYSTWHLIQSMVYKRVKTPHKGIRYKVLMYRILIKRLLGCIQRVLTLARHQQFDV